MQLGSSLPVLLWASWRRRWSFLTLVIAVASYFAAAGLAFVLRAALSPMTTSTFVQTVVVLLCGVTAMAAAGCVAALIRPGAAPLLAALVLGAASLMMAMNPDSVPLWYEGSFLVLGPLAPIAGAALSRRWRKAC
jgi:peptidoglycan/LPS O-acetylase OafA/YrhL